MSNANLTIRDRIKSKILLWAYTNARQLGYTATEATEEAFEVADFVKWVMA